MARKIAEHLGVIGLLAVEMFLTVDGQLFVNELAPRPHNSGHYTMDACRTSQFEQHLRAVCNLPLGSTQLLSPVVMVNLLGQHVAPTVDWMLQHDEYLNRLGITAKIHLYGKHEAKHQRKMGHINLLCNDVEDALQWVLQSNIWEDSKHA
jgi:5-(carboxyamino)imidazole ribonucleotide synthase